MNIEMERKFKIDNFEKIQNKIKKIGAKLENTKTTDDFYFKVPQRVKKTKYLRIRSNQKNGDGTLAYHEVVDDLQTKEWEIDIDNTKIAQQILEKLGFQLEVKVKKERMKYRLGNVEILLDKVEELGNFIEIETPDLDTLEKIAKNLELDNKNIISGAGYPDLIKEQNETNNK